VSNLKGAGDLLGETPLSTYFKALKVRAPGLLGVQDHERRGRRREAVRASSLRVLESVDEVFLGTRA